ncbi:hypothetical protein IW261DRAFT_1345740 [Armillaria novae-zelandiae]|uniref:Reverse transcriptase zinc-binding domain-containing protein n=1 Tax=Armillaria novae-zelandiae TaxID=153914 RepID=A0AA39NNE5_9AGAR|nr:hypothetical protein IW261DRAFT_1345740 [Armillaria novae-zelandiae]
MIVDLNIDPKLQITGATLSKLTQKRAYQALRERSTQSLPRRAKTSANINLAIEGAKASFGKKTSEPALWKSLRHRDIDRSTRYFLWMTMHDAYRIGGKWLHFDPQYHERAYCSHCNNSLESMDHILLRCSSPGQREIWELTKKLLEMRGIPWHQPEMSNILTCAAPVFKSQSGHRESGKERFFRITISSSVQTIWNARCERVIQRDNAPFSNEEIINKWKKKVNRRLELDCLMTRERFGKKALSKDLVLKTWAGSILNEHQLPQDWTEADGVLVGIG